MGETSDELELSGIDVLPELEEADATTDDGHLAEQMERIAEAERFKDRHGPGFEPY